MTPNLAVLKRIAQAKQALAQALEAACRAYAIGSGAGKTRVPGQAAPIVDDRFKGAGNARFVPLSPDYARQKNRMAPSLRKGIKATGRVVPKGKATAGLPILVRTGKLRARVGTGGTHRIVVSPDGMSAVITFSNLPGYAVYHHQGSGKLPVRSPVVPNEADRQKFIAVMQRVLRMRLGELRLQVAQPTALADNSTPRGAGPGAT